MVLVDPAKEGRQDKQSLCSPALSLPEPDTAAKLERDPDPNAGLCSPFPNGAAAEPNGCSPEPEPKAGAFKPDPKAGAVAPEPTTAESRVLSASEGVS